MSDKMNITYGVPQGSILGPLMFNMYVNDLPSLTTKSSIVMYADDTAIVFSDNDSWCIQTVLNEDLKKVKLWLDENKLTLNTKKTKFMIFGTRRRLAKSKNIQINIDEESIERVTSFKYLGVWMDEILSFTTHVDKLSKKISSRIAMIQRASGYLTLENKKILFNTMVLPYFDYCSHVWSNVNSKTRNKLVRLHKRGCRMLLKVPKMTPTEDVLRQLSWGTLEKRWEKNRACFVYKMLNNEHPDYMTNYFVEVQQCHKYSTRHAQSRALCLNKINNECGRRTLQYSGAKLWNSIPSALRQMTSYDSFKRNYHKYA